MEWIRATSLMQSTYVAVYFIKRTADIGSASNNVVLTILLLFNWIAFNDGILKAVFLAFPFLLILIWFLANSLRTTLGSTIFSFSTNSSGYAHLYIYTI